MGAFLGEATNVLTVIYSHVYFPVYTNSLKEIAAYLGFRWTENGASGIGTFYVAVTFSPAGADRSGESARQRAVLPLHRLGRDRRGRGDLAGRKIRGVQSGP